MKIIEHILVDEIFDDKLRILVGQGMEGKNEQARVISLDEYREILGLPDYVEPEVGDVHRIIIEKTIEEVEEGEQHVKPSDWAAAQPEYRVVEKKNVVRCFPLDKQRRLEVLTEKNSTGTITEAEYRELRQLVEEEQKLAIENAKWLLEQRKRSIATQEVYDLRG